MSWPSESVPWLRSTIALLLACALGWWCIGQIPARVSPRLPSGHWLARYQRPDRTFDLASVCRDMRGVAGPPDENLAAILVRELGTDALTPDAQPDLLTAFGVTPAPHGERLYAVYRLTLEPQEVAFVANAAEARGRSSSKPRFQDAMELSGRQPWQASKLPSVAAWLDTQQPLLASALTWKPMCLRIPWTRSQDPSSTPECLRCATLRPARPALGIRGMPCIGRGRSGYHSALCGDPASDRGIGSGSGRL